MGIPMRGRSVRQAVQGCVHIIRRQAESYELEALIHGRNIVKRRYPEACGGPDGHRNHAVFREEDRK